jgi:hypothetical protein
MAIGFVQNIRFGFTPEEHYGSGIGSEATIYQLMIEPSEPELGILFEETKHATGEFLKGVSITEKREGLHEPKFSINYSLPLKGWRPILRAHMGLETIEGTSATYRFMGAGQLPSLACVFIDDQRAVVFIGCVSQSLKISYRAGDYLKCTNAFECSDFQFPSATPELTHITPSPAVASAPYHDWYDVITLSVSSPIITNSDIAECDIEFTNALETGVFESRTFGSRGRQHLLCSSGDVKVTISQISQNSLFERAYRAQELVDFTMVIQRAVEGASYRKTIMIPDMRIIGCTTSTDNVQKHTMTLEATDHTNITIEDEMVE